MNLFFFFFAWQKLSKKLKKMKKKYFYCMMMCLAGLLVGCSDDDVKLPDNVIPVLKGSTGEELTITHLGFSCDITQEIGNSREHILNLNALKKDGALVLDENAENMYIEATGEDYASMTNSLNKYLVGNVPSVPQMAFSWNLDAISDKKANQLDIFEYGVVMTIKKLYGVNVKQEFVSNLKDYVRESVWAEINATDKSNRTDKAEIKQLYKTYGTHVATRISVGGMHQGVLFREQNYWESDMKAQLYIFAGGIMPYPYTGSGFTTSGVYDASITGADLDCYEYASQEKYEYKKGGNFTTGNADEWDEWFNSVTLENCEFLGYGLSMEVSGQNSGLIPLYELLLEGDERRTAMKEALDEYVKENTIPLETCRMVIVDAFGKHFKDGEEVPAYLYDSVDDDEAPKQKYFRLDDNMFDYVRGVTDGKFHFYYALGHSQYHDEAVVDMKFAESSDINGDWVMRGNHANAGVTGDVRNRYLCIKYGNTSKLPENEFVTGFAIRLEEEKLIGDDKIEIKALSKGAQLNNNWIKNSTGVDWYLGLVHDDVYCIYTKDNLMDF